MTKRTAKLGLGWGQSTPCSGLKQLLRLCMKRTLFSFRDVPHRPLIISSCHVRLPNFPFFSLSFYPDVNSVIVSPRLLKTTTLSWSWEREREAASRFRAALLVSLTSLLINDALGFAWENMRRYRMKYLNTISLHRSSVEKNIQLTEISCCWTRL